LASVRCSFSLLPPTFWVSTSTASAKTVCEQSLFSANTQNRNDILHQSFVCQTRRRGGLFQSHRPGRTRQGTIPPLSLGSSSAMLRRYPNESEYVPTSTTRSRKTLLSGAGSTFMRSQSRSFSGIGSKVPQINFPHSVMRSSGGNIQRSSE